MSLGIVNSPTPQVNEAWFKPDASVGSGKVDHERPAAGRQIRMLIREAEAESRKTNRPLRHTFQRLWRGMLGLRDYKCDNHLGYTTHFEPSKQTVHYEDLPIREVSRELLGGDTMDSLRNGKTCDTATHEIREALAPVTASSQQDGGSLYSIYVGGIFEQKTLEGLESPEFVGRRLIPSEPTNQREARIFTTANVPGPSKNTHEGVPFPNVGVQPRWIIRPILHKRGLTVSLTREAQVFGLGGSLMESLQNGGRALGYQRDYITGAQVYGQNVPVGQQWFANGFNANTLIYSNAPNSTPNNTYQTSEGSGPYAYVNQFTGQSGLQSYLQLQAARQALSVMKEFETGMLIRADLKQIVVTPGAVDTAFNVLHSTNVVQVPGGFPTSGQGIMQWSPNPPLNSGVEIISSSIWNSVLLDADVSQSNANKWWLAGQLDKAFGWASCWDSNIVPMDPRSSSMVESDTIFGCSFSWMGCPYTREPRYCLEYTN